MNRVFLFLLFLPACSFQNKFLKENHDTRGFSNKAAIVNFSTGIVVYNERKIDYKDDLHRLKIHFKEPVVVGVASKPEKWGFFQFPKIERRMDNALQIRWKMSKDAIEAYGDDTHGAALSFNGGKSFVIIDSAQTTGSVNLPNGDKLELYRPKALNEKDLKMPEPIGQWVRDSVTTGRKYYRLHDLPESRNGIYFKRLKNNENEWKLEKAKLIDENAARYSLRGLVPVMFWGDIKLAGDGSLIAGIYPGYYIDDTGKVDTKSAVFFYRSTDNGHTWKIQGRILYYGDEAGDSLASKRMGYTEPAFEILKDGTFLCVLRTTDGAGNGPMYASYSKDMGKTWTQPQIIAPNGVLPRLLQLENGVTVLSSGRPGVQLRFSTDPVSMKWSKPFEVLPYMIDSLRRKENEVNGYASCGYTGLLPIDKNRLLLVYSDFAYKNQSGEIRKAIKVREIEVFR